MTAPTTTAALTPEELAARIELVGTEAAQEEIRQDIAAAIRQHSEAQRAEIERMAKENERAEAPRYMDEIEAGRVAWSWIEGIVRRDDLKAPHTTIKTDRLKGDGGTVELWHKDRLVAVALVLRDGWNWSVLACMEFSGREEPARATTAEAALAKVTAERDVALAQAQAMRSAQTKEEATILEIINQRDTAEDALGDLFSMVTGRPPEWSNLFGYSEALDECEEALAASLERERGMREALTVAANRLARCAIDHPSGSREMSERSEWAEEARAAGLLEDKP